MVAMQRELIIDGFAGGGGASSGIERALGILPSITTSMPLPAIKRITLEHAMSGKLS